MRGETNILATNRTELFSNKPIPAIILEKKKKNTLEIFTF